MDFLRWLGGIVVLIWILCLVLKVAGILIHLLLLVAVIVFLYDFFLKLKK